MSDNFFKRNKSIIFPIYISKKDLKSCNNLAKTIENLAKSKEENKNLVIETELVEKLTPRQCECGKCGGMLFIPKIDAKYQNIKYEHLGGNLKELREEKHQQKLFNISVMPFELNIFKKYLNDNKITKLKLSLMLNITLIRVGKYLKNTEKERRSMPIPIQVKILELFPDLKLKDGIDREKFISEYKDYGVKKENE